MPTFRSYQNIKFEAIRALKNLYNQEHNRQPFIHHQFHCVRQQFRVVCKNYIQAFELEAKLS